VEKRWRQLTEAVKGCDQILILLHDDPDPDSVASGEALRFLLSEQLGVEGQIGYRGVIGRAENRALVDYLGVELQELSDEPFTLEHGSRAVAVVDTQPGAGNSPLPADYPAAIVIDHHSDLGEEGANFRDVRPWIGASSTILTQYLRAAGIKPPMRLATALFYGIKTDTKALSRDTSAADVGAYFYLLSFVDVDALVEIENAQVPAAYFRNLARAMEAAKLYDGVVVSFLGATDYPDLTAEIADLFLRLEGVNWVVCMGVYDETLYISVRSRDEAADAEKLAQAIIGEQGTAGGRNTLAGGQISVEGKDAEAIAEELRQRTLEYLDVPQDAQGEPLI
jgi:nanoRNase/pAp phosphatase (c-di-AMP/oligoRNAs hydrolase)